MRCDRDYLDPITKHKNKFLLVCCFYFFNLHSIAFQVPLNRNLVLYLKRNMVSALADTLSPSLRGWPESPQHGSFINKDFFDVKVVIIGTLHSI